MKVLGKIFQPIASPARSGFLELVVLRCPRLRKFSWFFLQTSPGRDLERWSAEKFAKPPFSGFSKFLFLLTFDGVVLEL